MVIKKIVTSGRFKGMLRSAAQKILSKEYYAKDKGDSQKKYWNSLKGKTTTNIRLYRKKVDREKYPHKHWITPKVKDKKVIHKEMYKKTIEKAKVSPGGLAAWKKAEKIRKAKWYSETKPLRLIKHRKHDALHKNLKTQHIKDWKKQKALIKAYREQSWWTDDVQVSGICV